MSTVTIHPPERLPVKQPRKIAKTPSKRLGGGVERAMLAARTAEDNRGTDIVILDMRELTSVFDFFIIVSGTSRRQLHAMSEEIDRVFEQELGDRRLGIEGYEESRWILLDYGDLVIHLFEPETRDYYALEQLWSQAKRVPFEPRALKGLGIGD
jgi:ribosome-associated protein